jgi:hypothetical protein
LFRLLDVLDVAKGLRVGIAAGSAGASVCLAACWIVTETGPLTPGSLAVALTPWWANWKIALGGFTMAGLLFGVGAATRPPKRKG